MGRRSHRRRALDPDGRVRRPRLGAAAKGGWRSSAAAAHAAAWWPTGWSGRGSMPSTWPAACRPGTPPRCRSNRWTAGSRERAGGHLLLGGRIAQQALVPARRQLGRGAPALVRGALRHGRGQLQLLRPAHRGDGDRLGATHAARLRVPRQGVRDDDPPPGAGRAAAARHALGGGVRRAGPDRPPFAGAAKRGLPALPARGRAAARGRKAGRGADAAAPVRGLQAVVVRLPGVGAGAAHRSPHAGRVPAPQLAHRRAPRADAGVPGAAAGQLRDRRRTAR